MPGTSGKAAEQMLRAPDWSQTVKQNGVKGVTAACIPFLATDRPNDTSVSAIEARMIDDNLWSGWVAAQGCSRWQAHSTVGITSSKVQQTPAEFTPVSVAFERGNFRQNDEQVKDRKPDFQNDTLLPRPLPLMFQRDWWEYQDLRGLSCLNRGYRRFWRAPSLPQGNYENAIQYW